MTDYKPKIGEECEFFSVETGEWERITPDYMGDKFLLFHSNGVEEAIQYKLSEFRPLRTKEDLEREEGIQQMIDLTRRSSMAQPVCTALYDAGYRLVGEEVKGIGELTGLGFVYYDAEALLKHYDIYRKVVK